MSDLQNAADGEAGGSGMPHGHITAPDDEMIQNTLRTYSRFFWCQMRGQGLLMELEEVAGELGVVYAQALKGYKSQSPAAFGTYLHKAFVNRVATLKNELSKSRQTPVIPLFGNEMVDARHDEGIEDAFAEKEAHAQFSAGLTGTEKIIFDEMISPSDTVIRRAQALKNKTNRGSHIAAICEVHQLKKLTAYNALKKIKRGKILLDKYPVSA